MFSLHEATKIHVCRAAFVALAVIPTVLVLVYSLVIRLPHYTQAHEQAIAAQLGLHAKLSRASSPRPGMMLYEGLELSDPDTHQLLARLPFVEVRADDEDVHVRLPHPATINGARLDVFWNLTRDQVRQARAWREVHLEAQNLTLHFGEGDDQSLTDLHGRIDNIGEETRLQLVGRRAGAVNETDQGAELIISWRRDPVAPSSTIQFVSGATPLPCSSAAPIWPILAQLGRGSQFQGRIAVVECQGHWRAEFAGQLSDVDLDRSVGQHSIHQLTGPATAEIEHLAIEDGRIESASGKLTAGPGVIGRSFVESAQRHLQLRVLNEVLLGSGSLISYKQLALAFELSAAGLTVHGALPGTAGGLLAGERRVLISEPTADAQPVVNLVRTLVPQDNLQVPATRETDALTRALPIPSIHPTVNGRPPTPQAKATRVRNGSTVK
jgi:hypothetical protein